MDGTFALVCCGGTLLVFALISAGVTIPLAFLSSALPYLALLGLVLAAGALLWFFQRRCSACPWSPPKQNEANFVSDKEEK